ncbi:MAG TPA: hypothetical protein VKI19_12675, partial [Acidimicrobiales bacterium]|nr:hypothetical protein [Acidimicrobiales bacterium]
MQDALAAAVGDPLGDAVADLDAESLLAMLRTGHQIGQVREFMKDHGVPARYPDLVAARRLLPRLGEDKGAHRRRANRWLASDLN